MFGFLNVDKPSGITAHDVVARIRRASKIKRIGHGGTLDPMATGVLPVAVGNACRLLRFLPQDKTYLAEIRLGQQTTTDDIEGDIISSSEALPEKEAIMLALKDFEGAITQKPPLFSAVHVQGQRLYQLARANITPPEIPLRHVTVHKLEPIEYTAPILKVRIHCSSGTYIRSIARDLGDKLNCGGCLHSLRREQAGCFILDQSIGLSNLTEAIGAGKLSSLLVAPETILGLKNVHLDQKQAEDILHGRKIYLELGLDQPSDLHIIVSFQNALIAVCNVVHQTDHRLPAEVSPEVVFNNG